MEEITLKVEGITLNEETRKKIVDQLFSVFGFNKYKIKKIVIKISEDKISKNNIKEVACALKIHIENHPIISVDLKSQSIFTAISLSIERAHLKFMHSLSDERINRQCANTLSNSRYITSEQDYR